MIAFGIAALFVTIMAVFEPMNAVLSNEELAARVIVQAAGVLCLGLAISLS